MDSSNNYRVVGDCENRIQSEQEVKTSVRPEIDIAACNRCGGCLELGPEIFRENETFGFIEVAELDYYDPEIVLEAVKNCPKRAISIDRD